MADDELEVFGDEPLARFGHTITLVSYNKVVLFGGATGDTGKYVMTGDTYLFNIISKKWVKLNGKVSLFLKFSRQRSSSKPKSSSLLNKRRADADGSVWRSHWGWFLSL